MSRIISAMILAMAMILSADFLGHVYLTVHGFVPTEEQVNPITWVKR